MATAIQLLLYGLTTGAVVALSAAAFTLTYAVGRQINMAHGNVVAITTVALAYAALWLGVTADTPLPGRIGALLLLVLIGALLGAGLTWAVERLAFAPFAAGADRLAPLVATVGLSFVLFQVAVWWYALTREPTDTGVVGHIGVTLPLLAVPDLVPPLALELGGVVLTLEDAIVLLAAAAAAVGGDRLLARTRLGRLVRATAADAELAALCGVDPARARALGFAAAGLLLGVAAAIAALYYGGAAAHHGLRGGLAAMTAAILGGAGNLRGALAGGLVLGIVSAYADYLVDARWTPLILLVLLVVLLALRPGGLLGAAAIDAPAEGAAALAPARGTGGPGLLVGLLVGGLLFAVLDDLLGWGRLHSAASALHLVALALGLAIVVGMAGLLDLGYAAFVAVGAYTAALLAGAASAAPGGTLASDPWIGLGLAAAAAALVGLLFGLPSVRTRGEYLAIVTIALGELVPAVLQGATWAGGAGGLSGVRAPPLGPWPVGSPRHAYALALLLALVVAAAALRLGRSRIGRAWAALREDEIAASSVGVSPPRLRLAAFVIGAIAAGLVGAIAAGQAGYVDPTRFDFTLSLMALAAVILGWRWGLGGVVLAALALAVYDRALVDLLNDALRAAGGSIDLRAHNLALFGAALYLSARLRPRATSIAAAG